MCIKVGAPAPDAAADYWIKGAHGPKRMTLAEHRGKWLVLFFYPRDFTFICPTELVALGNWKPTSRPRKRYWKAAKAAGRVTAGMSCLTFLRECEERKKALGM